MLKHFHLSSSKKESCGEIYKRILPQLFALRVPVISTTFASHSNFTGGITLFARVTVLNLKKRTVWVLNLVSRFCSFYFGIS